MERQLTPDAWIILSPFVIGIAGCLVWNLAVAIRLVARLWQARHSGQPVPKWASWLHWGAALFLSGAWFLAWDLPRLTRHLNVFATGDGETALAVAVLLGTLYALLALIFGSALFFLAGVEARATDNALRGRRR